MRYSARIAIALIGGCSWSSARALPDHFDAQLAAHRKKVQAQQGAAQPVSASGAGSAAAPATSTPLYLQRTIFKYVFPGPGRIRKRKPAFIAAIVRAQPVEAQVEKGDHILLTRNLMTEMTQLSGPITGRLQRWDYTITRQSRRARTVIRDALTSRTKRSVLVDLSDPTDPYMVRYTGENALHKGIRTAGRAVPVRRTLMGLRTLIDKHKKTVVVGGALAAVGAGLVAIEFPALRVAGITISPELLGKISLALSGLAFWDGASRAQRNDILTAYRGTVKWVDDDIQKQLGEGVDPPDLWSTLSFA